MDHAISPRKVIEVTPVNIDGAIAYEVSGKKASIDLKSFPIFSVSFI